LQYVAQGIVLRLRINALGQAMRSRRGLSPSLPIVDVGDPIGYGASDKRGVYVGPR